MRIGRMVHELAFRSLPQAILKHNGQYVCLRSD